MFSIAPIPRFGAIAGTLVAVALLAPRAGGSDSWPQWRGPARNGMAADEPALRESLPPEGLTPQWLSETLPGGGRSGWGSPAIAGGRVYVFVPDRTKPDDLQLPPREFPGLSAERRAAMTDAELREYQEKQREEQRERAAQFRFEETLHCLDLESGETLWSTTRPGHHARFAPSATPTVMGGRVYVLGSGRTAHCFDAADGQHLWSRELPGKFQDEFFQSSFLVADGIAVVLCGRLFGLDSRDGSVLWQSEGPAGAQGHSSPVLWRGEGSEPLVICNMPNGKTEAFQLQSGEPQWSLSTGARHSTPVVCGDRLFTYGSSRKRALQCYRLGPETPEHLWTYQRTADPGSSPVVTDEAVYVVGGKRLACVDPDTGESHWQTTLSLSNPRYASPIVAGGQLLYAWEGLLAVEASPKEFQLFYQAAINRDGTLARNEDMRRLLGIDDLESTAAGQAEAERAWQQQVVRPGPLTCSTPAIADGRLVLRLRDKVVCYDLSSE